MIIAEKYALRLITQGKAICEGIMRENEKHYMIITRFDLQRTDHVLIKEI